GWGEVAGEKSHGLLQALGGLAAHPAVSHPGATALVVPGEKIEIKRGDFLLSALPENPVVADIWMPGVHPSDDLDLDAKQALHYGEHALDNPLHREIGFEHFLGEVVFGLPQFFAVVAGIPGLQIGAALVGGEGAQL